jgi:hypothetical protein
MRDKDYIVVIGSANMDVAGYSHDSLNYADSNPGKIKFTPGGVGRNIAQNLASLNKPVWLLSAVGNDFYGQSLLAQTRQAGYNEKIAEAARMGRPIPDPYWKPGDSMDAQHPVLEKLPYIVVLVDEFADLMMTVGKKVEELIARLAQKARAAGIHLVLAVTPSPPAYLGDVRSSVDDRRA